MGCENIRIGSANVYIDTAGVTAFNALTATDLGKTTEDGATIEFTQEFFKAKVDQKLGPVKKKAINKEAVVSCNLAEVTAENMALALGVPSDEITSGKFSFPSDEQSLTKAVIVRSNVVDDEGKRMIVILPYAVIGADSVSVLMQKSGATNIPFSAEALQDCTTDEMVIVDFEDESSS
jgi:hypothetical protein